VAAETEVRALAILTVIASVGLALVATAFAWLNVGTVRDPVESTGAEALDLSNGMGVLIFTATGALIALRQPRHPVAWCFLLLGLIADLFLALLNYGVYGLTTAPGAVPAAHLARWIAGWLWAAPLAPLVFAILLFPDGRPPSVRWWPVAWLTLVGMALLFAFDGLVSRWLAPELVPPALAGPLAWTYGLAILMYAAGLLGAAASLIVRFRRSRGAERQQLKWVACAAAVSLSLLAATFVGESAPSALVVLANGSVMFIPISAAIAILRYRLYDIDVVIERTLVYGVVSATLGATYYLTVVVLQSLLRPLTGASELAVALSTLLVVALFQPLRARVQRVIDRRFYRARYDAGRIIDAFAVRLRSDVDLDSVRTHLLAVVHDAIHPTHASVWLRRSGR